MTNEQVQLLALVFAANARIVGMQAENRLRESVGDSPTYGEGHFQEEAQHLENLSVQAINS